LEAQRLGGLEVYHQIEFGRLLDREVSRIHPMQNLVHIVAPAGCLGIIFGKTYNLSLEPDEHATTELPE